jgi:hypothetical protein
MRCCDKAHCLHKELFQSKIKTNDLCHKLENVSQHRDFLLKKRDDLEQQVDDLSREVRTVEDSHPRKVPHMLGPPKTARPINVDWVKTDNWGNPLARQPHHSAPGRAHQPPRPQGPTTSGAISAPPPTFGIETTPQPLPAVGVTMMPHAPPLLL